MPQPKVRPKQVRDHYQISQSTYFRWLNDGMPVIRKGRVVLHVLEDIDRWLTDDTATAGRKSGGK